MGCPPGSVVARRARVDVDAQDLAQVGRQVLAVADGHVVADAPVVGITAVTGRHVQHAVRAEADPVAVVVELRPDEVDAGCAAPLGSATFLSVDDTVYSSTTLLWSYHSI